jgi:flagellar assembly protein FliH
VSDPSVQPGGCRIETPQGEIDATVATRWRRVISTLGVDQPAWTELDAGDGKSA